MDYMKKIAISLCLTILLIYPLFASVNDTIRLDEVIVTGSMPKVNLRNLPMSISVVSENQIEARKDNSLLPLLNEEVPGLFITQRGVMGYGVAGGAAGAMSIRGIGGAPTAGVLVLIDGHPQYMGLMGHPLADSYQSMMTERVEVVRGPASVLYGSNAMGGVINIITKQKKQEGIHNSARLMFGSHNTLSAEVASGGKHGRFSTTLNLGYNKSDGHRENMEFEQFNGYTRIGYNMSANWKSFADFNLSKTLSSNPGAVTAPIVDNDADIIRGVASAVIENEYADTSGALKFFYNFGYHDINDGYPINSSYILDTRFNSNDMMLGFTAYQSYSFFRGNKTTAGFDFQRFGGKAVQRYPLSMTSDSTLADVSINNVAGYVNIQQSVLNNKITFNAGLRFDHHELKGSEWIPQLGLSYSPTPYTSLKAILSKGFRNPTIREMYMFPPQNPDLKSERLMNYELSLLQSFPDARVSMGVNLFYIKGDNMIQVDFVNGRPLNVNSGEVENKGFELTFNYQATENLNLSANYSFLDMTYKIVGAPEHKFYVSGIYTYNRWNFSTGFQYLGNLYTAVKPEQKKDNALLLNARINYQTLDWMNFFVRGENLLDKEYEINAGYPMPGVTLFGGIGLQF
ncbi:MAG: TonB-dependent receptor [Fermentimonas sp.]|nr:TonB-dependent receptor [Fermentimonas sp.]